jgi:condensin complex subunit 3
LALFATHPNGRSEEECPTVAERIMTRLVGLAHAEDKAVRYRVCQLLASIFNNLPPDAEVTEELADNMMAAMLERMKDKVPQVRAQAARALARLVDPGEVASPP